MSDNLPADTMVFVVAGQSNAAGHGNGFEPSRTGMVWALNTQGAWQPLDHHEGLPGAMAVGSCWPYFGDMLALRYHCPVAFANVAEGGTNSGEWVPGSILYARLMAALSKAEARAVLWHQGEADTALNAQNPARSHDDTYRNMRNMIVTSRLEAGYPVPWYVARASWTQEAPPKAMQQVRYAQRRIVKDGLALPGPDTDRYIPECLRHDNLHFSRQGLWVAACLWLRALEWGEDVGERDTDLLD